MMGQNQVSRFTATPVVVPLSISISSPVAFPFFYFPSSRFDICLDQLNLFYFIFFKYDFLIFSECIYFIQDLKYLMKSCF